MLASHVRSQLLSRKALAAGRLAAAGVPRLAVPTLVRAPRVAALRALSAAAKEPTATDADSKEAPKAAPEEETSGSPQEPKAAPKPPTRFSKWLEDAKDVVAVAFGMERKRNIEAEYDAGVRAYPWISYTDPVSGTVLYKNNDSGVITETKPPDFDARAPASARDVALNEEVSAITVRREELSPWDRTVAALGATPVIAQLVGAVQAVAATETGQAVKAKAAAVKAKVADKVEDAREVWETSQHPLVVNAAYVVDNIFSETEQGRALREIKQLDGGFDSYQFVQDMQEQLLPVLAKAFFQMDMPVLRRMCKDTALAQMKAVQAAREVEGLTMDGTILQVQRVEVVTARSLERGLPIILVSAQVQYVHAVRNKKGEVVEGSDSEIRAAFFVVAVTREYEPATGALEWKVVEVSMQGSMLYL